MPIFLKFESEFYKCEQSGGKLTINLKNDWNYKLPAQIWTQTSALIGSKKFNKIVLNFKDAKELDYAAALFFKNTFLNARKN